MTERFSDRTAVVTAGRGGIGAATARRLVDEGAAVAVKGLGSLDVLVDNEGRATAVTEATARRLGMETAGHQRLVAKDTPLRRVRQHEDVASVIALLASDDASYVSNQVIYISGGAR